MTTSFVTYTFADAKIAEGTLKVKVFNYRESPPGDENIEFLFFPDYEIEQNIEDDANVLQISRVKFKAKNKSDVFKSKILYMAGNIVDARIQVNLSHTIEENLFYGVIDPASIRYSEKQDVVEFSALGLLSEAAGLVVDISGVKFDYGVTARIVKQYLNGTRVLGKTAAGYSAGATVIGVNLNSIKTGIPYGSVVRFGADTNEYTVAVTSPTSITINPALVNNVSSNADIKSKDYRISSGGVNYVKVENVIKAIGWLTGHEYFGITASRMRWRRSGGSPTEYYYLADLVIRFDDFFQETTPPAESFISSDDSDGAAGILKRLCYGFCTYVETIIDSSGRNLIFQHRNEPSASTPTMEKAKDAQTSFDWNNVYHEFSVAYPTSQTYKSTSVPFHKTLAKTLSVTIPFGAHGSASVYRLLIYSGGTIYEIADMQYLVPPANTTWQTNTDQHITVAMALRDLFADVEEVREETYKTLFGKIGSNYWILNLRLGQYITSNNNKGVSKKFYIKRIVRRPMTNETVISRYEERT